MSSFPDTLRVEQTQVKTNRQASMRSLGQSLHSSTLLTGEQDPGSHDEYSYDWQGPVAFKVLLTLEGQALGPVVTMMVFPRLWCALLV